MTMIIWVYSPGSDSTSMVPPCCRMMSLVIASPRPVPWLVGLVVKNGLNILSMISWGIPGPLSLMRISTSSCLPLVASQTVGA